ncbi:MAG TPA: hypothetical protein VK930_04800 [Verrucomicrobiae bacterium]|jgi:hypothetical protein|nr:hypothetical protein [Verrucomicrobiae bacterium]
MKKSYFAAVLTLTCLLGVGISANAQDPEGVSVKVPFEFVAGGATLPAGTYTVGRISIDGSSGIAIRTYGHGAFALPIVVDGTPAKALKLSFERVGDMHFLTEADTPGGVYTFALPKAMVALAQAKDQGTVSSGGTN